MRRRQALPLVAFFGISWMVVEEVFGARLYRQYDLMQIVWCRYGAHLLLMLALWGWRQPSLLWRTRRPVFQLSRSMLMLVMPLSFALAVGQGTAFGLVWAVFWSTPLLVMLLAHAMLSERVPATHWLAAGAATAAAVAILAPAGSIAPQQLLLPAAMALSFSLYVVMTRSLRGETFQANLFYSALGVFVLLSPRMPAVWLAPPLHDVVLLAAIGVLGFVSLLALDRAAERAPVSSWAPALPLQLAAVAVFGWSHGHAPAVRALLGVLVIAAVALYLWRRAPRPRAGEAPLALNG